MGGASVDPSRRVSVSDSSSAGHVVALDGLRFLAFLGVFLYHALDPFDRLDAYAQYGKLGVQLFFVLSGFLIGGILIQLRRSPEVPKGPRLKTFYARRALRIFPIYYLTLLALLILDKAGVGTLGGSNLFVWNVAYLTNVKYFLDDGMFTHLGHLWSLAVEEQFYLIAPVLLLTLSIRWLSWSCVAICVGAAVGRMLLRSGGHEVGWVLSPLQFDCMAIGVAGAILQARGKILTLDRRRVLIASAVAALMLVPLLSLWNRPGLAPDLAGDALDNGVFSIASLGLILLVWNVAYPRLNQVFSLGPVAYLGKISYALYLFHPLCLVAIRAWITPNEFTVVVLGFLLTVGLAALSWHVFEGPINGLKRFVPYARAPTPRQPDESSRLALEP